MRSQSAVVLSLLLGAAPLALVPSAALAQSCTCPSPGIRADVAPPPLPDYEQPPMPGPDYIWTPGYWSWNNVDYYWVPGTWERPPRSGLLWTPGYWHYDNNVYVYSPGYWGEHVGFYGGVAYGYGYTGSGYQGGYWRDNAFYYNRAANNFGAVNVNNVYEKTIVVDKTTVINRVSYNGGNGGTTLRPTPQEEAVARETHVPPTQAQAAHLRAASTNDALFATSNHGKPAIAATSRSGNFSGEGVIAAKAAGSARETVPGTAGRAPATEASKPPAGTLKPNMPAEGENGKPDQTKPLEAKPGAPKPQSGEPATHSLPGVAPAVRAPGTEPPANGQPARKGKEMPKETQPQRMQPENRAAKPAPTEQNSRAPERAGAAPVGAKHGAPKQPEGEKLPAGEQGGGHDHAGEKPRKKPSNED